MDNLKKDLNSIIFQTKEPILLRKYLKWSIFDWNLHKWNETIGNEELEFRCGMNAKTIAPQWERTTPKIRGKFSELQQVSDTNKWIYFDYKYLNEWLLGATELRQSINFKDLGLDNVDVNDSTIWIGTKGAHTPCHIDTYGCNVVIQVYGKKLWLLFPNNQDLKPSRIPYEEASIYSKLNFHSPTNLSHFAVSKGITDCKMVTLHPGDVLIVPHKWWHYVENLETSISINTWLSLAEDDKERLNECLVQILTKSFLKDLNNDEQDVILNPNSEIGMCSSAYAGVKFFNELMNYSSSKSETKEVADVEQVLERYKFIHKVESVSIEELKIFLENQSLRFSNNCVEEENKKEINIEKLVHAVTHPDVIHLMMNKLLGS